MIIVLNELDTTKILKINDMYIFLSINVLQFKYIQQVNNKQFKFLMFGVKCEG